MSLPSLGAVNAVLSVTEAEGRDDYTVRLSVSRQDVPDPADQTASAALPRAAAGELVSDEAVCRCFGQGATQQKRMEAGQKLFDTVFRDDVAALWATLPPIADAGHRLRVRLDVQPTELAALPWELLSSGGQWAFLRRHVSLWRGPAPQPTAVEPDRGPLRILVVVCNPADHHLLSDQEIAKILGALESRLGHQHVEILDGPSRTTLST
jgi:hypothetical protein